MHKLFIAFVEASALTLPLSGLSFMLIKICSVLFLFTVFYGTSQGKQSNQIKYL